MDTRWSRSSLLYLVVFLTVFGDATAAQENFTLQTAVIIVAGIAAIYIVVCIVLLLALCRVCNMKCCHRGKVCPITPSTKEKRKERKKNYLEIAGTKGLGKSKKLPGPVVRKLEKIPEEGTDDNVFINLAYEKDSEESSSSLSESNNPVRNSSSYYQRDIKSAATIITNLETDDSSIPSSPTDNSLTYI